VPERLNGPVLKTGGRKSRGFESHPLRHEPWLLALALLAGCYVQNRDAPEPRYFQFVFPASGQLAALPGQVADLTGMVSAVDVDPASPPVAVGDRPFVRSAPGRPTAVVVGWSGGTCDQRADLELGESGRRTPVFTLKLLSGHGGCHLEEVQRLLVVSFDHAVDPAAFELDIVQ
jgi:hypothetical protein